MQLAAVEVYFKEMIDDNQGDKSHLKIINSE
jgi:hypothetical protein